MFLRPAKGASQGDFAQVMSEDAGNVIELGRDNSFLGLSYFNRIGYARLEALSG